MSLLCWVESSCGGSNLVLTVYMTNVPNPMNFRLSSDDLDIRTRSYAADTVRLVTIQNLVQKAKKSIVESQRFFPKYFPPCALRNKKSKI